MGVLLPLKLSTSLTSQIVKGWELGNHHKQSEALALHGDSSQMPFALIRT